MLLIGACGGTDLDLSGQTWTLTEVAGAPATDLTIATLTFTDGTVGGNTGCNDFTGSYQLDGSSLTIAQPMAATTRACQGSVMDQETAVFDALAATTAFSISGSELTLLDESGNELAKYSAEG